jgi:hypothetical protein
MPRLAERIEKLSKSHHLAFTKIIKFGRGIVLGKQSLGSGSFGPKDGLDGLDGPMVQYQSLGLTRMTTLPKDYWKYANTPIPASRPPNFLLRYLRVFDFCLNRQSLEEEYPCLSSLLITPDYVVLVPRFTLA